MTTILKNFLADCKTRGLTKHTIETYKSNSKTFLEQYPDPVSVGQDELRDFLGTLRERELHGSTLKGYFASLSAMYDFLVYEGALVANPVPSFRKRYLSRLKVQYGGKNERQLASIPTMRALVSAAETEGIRTVAIIMLFAKTGMRKGESWRLREHDINFEDNTIRVPGRSKRTYRTAFVDNELRAVLKKYLAWRVERAYTDWLWISDAGGHLHPDRLGAAVTVSAERIGIHSPGAPLCERFTTHCGRHFLTTSLFRAGMNPQHIKYLRGDSLKKEAWQMYNHIEIEDVRAEYLRCIPKLLRFEQKLEVFL